MVGAASRGRQGRPGSREADRRVVLGLGPAVDVAEGVEQGEARGAAPLAVDALRAAAADVGLAVVVEVRELDRRVVAGGGAHAADVGEPVQPALGGAEPDADAHRAPDAVGAAPADVCAVIALSLIHISEPTRLLS